MFNKYIFVVLLALIGRQAAGFDGPKSDEFNKAKFLAKIGKCPHRHMQEVAKEGDFVGIGMLALNRSALAVCPKLGSVSKYVTGFEKCATVGALLTISSEGSPIDKAIAYDEFRRACRETYPEANRSVSGSFGRGTSV